MNMASIRGPNTIPFAVTMLSFVSALSTMPAAAQAPPAPLVVYSNVCFNEYSGDTHGSIIILLARGLDLDVVYVHAESWPRRPVLGAATVKDRQLQFEVTLEPGRTRMFNGTITPDEVAGNFAGAKVEHWKRRPADHSWADGECGS